MNIILLIFYFCQMVGSGQPHEETPRIKRASYAQSFHSDFLDNSERYRNFRGPTFRSSNIEISDKRCLDVVDKSRSPAVTVTTRLGTVEGRYFYLCDGPGVPEYDRPKPRNNQNRPKIYRNITTFLGIPYARPPTKDNGLRFKPPQFPPSWGVVSAVQYKPACPQSPMYYGVDKGVKETNEDCLYLNVFSPFVSLPLYNKYAVMVYIHGGDWNHGNANSFPAHMLVASQEVVVVSFNYRLGPLGFLATATNASAGNYGILDQAMAIEWVFDNIDAFNGDPQRITLFGPGVGAASAGLHMLSIRLGTKIRRVIAQSGAAVADWATIVDPTFIYNNSVEFAKKLNCYFNSTWRMVNCLRDRTITELQTTSIKPKVGWLQWGPVVDGHTRERERQFLPEPPEVLLKRSEVQFHPDFAYMAGVTRDEAVAMILEDPSLGFKKYKVSRKDFQEKINEFIHMYNYTLDTVALTKAISFLYMPWWDPENSTLLMEGYIKMLSDSYYYAPNDKMVKLLLEKGVKTYMYVLNCTAEGIKKLGDRDREIFNESVPHNTEYYFITGAPFMDHTLYPLDLDLDISEWTEADRNMSEFFMTAWANFAKFGNPTPIPLLENIKWKPMKLNNLQYLMINTTNFTSVMMTNYRQKESQFWNSYLPNLMEKVIPTWPPTLEPWEEQRDIYQASLWGVVGATGLFLILSVLCCCLYCRAKSKHLVSTEDIPEAVCTTPTSIDTLLNMKKTNIKDRYLPERVEIGEKHTQV